MDNLKKPSIDLSALSDISSMVTGIQSPDLNTKLGFFEIDVASIQEDRDQPRREFDKKSIEELAQSIEENGLKQPIAIRNDPKHVGKFIVCQGARRLRAYRLRGWKKIPAIFDQKFSRAGQVIENIQRQPLTAMEIAQYIKREISEGKSIRRIAKGLGKSPAFVFLYKNLLDIKPAEVKGAWDKGQIQDIQVLNDLMHLAKTYTQEVAAFIVSEKAEITRSRVKSLKEKLKKHVIFIDPGVEENEDGGPQKRTKRINNHVYSSGQESVFAFVSYRGDKAILLLKEASSKKKVMIKLEGGAEREVFVRDVSLLKVAKE